MYMNNTYTHQQKSKCPIPVQSTNKFIKYTGSTIQDPETGFYYNERPDWNGGSVLSIDQRILERIFTNYYQ